MNPFCCRCLEDFELAKEPASWCMGRLRKLSKAPVWIQKRFGGAKDPETDEDRYLCGNCYFDMSD